MRERKTEFRFFTVAEWEKEEAYLSQRHREGWRFTGVRLPGVYGFERCAPQEVVYRLDYNPEARAHREDYVQMFRDCGWEYVQDYMGYSYFRKPAPASERDAEIFCDDASRLEMMERVLKGRMLPLVAILLLVIVPVLIVEGQRTEPFSRFVTGRIPADSGCLHRGISEIRHSVLEANECKIGPVLSETITFPRCHAPSGGSDR